MEVKKCFQLLLIARDTVDLSSMNVEPDNTANQSDTDVEQQTTVGDYLTTQVLYNASIGFSDAQNLVQDDSNTLPEFSADEVVQFLQVLQDCPAEGCVYSSPCTTVTTVDNGCTAVLQSKSRSMLIDANMPNKHWGEALQTRVVSSKISGKFREIYSNFQKFVKESGKTWF